LIKKGTKKGNERTLTGFNRPVFLFHEFIRILSIYYCISKIPVLYLIQEVIDMTVTQERLNDACNEFSRALQAIKSRENKNTSIVTKKSVTLLSVNRTMACQVGYGK